MLESYVTPLLMSYVNKYIKNLKPSDLQLSLWGGDVVLSKLDLKLDVLEQVKYFKCALAVLTLIVALFWISTCLGVVLHVRLQGKIRLLKQRKHVPEWTKQRKEAWLLQWKHLSCFHDKGQPWQSKEENQRKHTETCNLYFIQELKLKVNIDFGPCFLCQP